MAEQGKRDFCTECRKETEYTLQKKNIIKNIRGKQYTFTKLRARKPTALVVG